VWWIVNKTKEVKHPFRTLGIVFVVLILLYPLCSYSIDSYNSFSESEGAGLRYLATRCNITNHTIDRTVSGQIDAYISPQTNAYLYGNLGITIDYVVYRKSVDFKYRLHNPDSEYYYFDMYSGLNQNNSYNKIYCNPNFIICMLGE
jgi:hypothetical protein